MSSLGFFVNAVVIVIAVVGPVVTALPGQSHHYHHHPYQPRHVHHDDSTGARVMRTESQGKVSQRRVPQRDAAILRESNDAEDDPPPPPCDSPHAQHSPARAPAEPARDPEKAFAAVSPNGVLSGDIAKEEAEAAERKRLLVVADVDCEYADWEDWSACQFTCGGGDSVRTRLINQQASGAGLPCTEKDKETRRCAQNACPVDCAYSDWSTWSECSATCGKGARTQRRQSVAPQYGGAECDGPLEGTRDCVLTECPKDCVWSQWTEWGGCSKTCGEGHEKRFREFTPGNAAGKPCNGEATVTRVCSQNECPVDCLAGEWSTWEGCSATCGKGFTTRNRVAYQAMAYGGIACPQTSETKDCTDLPVCITAPSNCAWDDWSPWSACSSSCGTDGKKQRNRPTATNEVGVACAGETFEEQPCFQPACPQDCHVSQWTTWSKCSVSCGIGIIERTRTLKEAADGGQDCPGGNTTHEKRRCSQGFCPVDCEFADWQDWAPCSTSCGEGHSNRLRLVKTQPSDGGRTCPASATQARDCNDKSCPENCVWGSWGEWNTCSKTCGSGKQTRERAVKIPATHHGQPCEGPATQEQSCEEEECSTDCKLLEWNSWSSCSSSCGSGGTRTRTRGSVPAQHDGLPCPEEQNETGSCEGLPACPSDCEWAEWGEWTACSASCGNGQQKRNRTRISYEKDGGQACGGNEDDERTCTVPACPIDCEMHDWSPWSKCSTTCGNGTRLRDRRFAQALNGGVDCEDATSNSQSEHSTCNNGACATDCIWKPWEDWSPCSRSCGAGYTFRTRGELIPATLGGTFCDGTPKEETVCNATACPTSCAWGCWSAWTNCTKSCGGGTRQRDRTITQQAQFGGETCAGNPKEKESCAEQPCPRDCSWSTWSLWSVCTQTCDSGQSTRIRHKATQAQYGGITCIGNANEQKACNTKGCPRDCEWAPWSQWTTCSKPCGGGIIQRSREVSVKSKNDGVQCLGSPQQEAECNMKPCATDCVWGEWTEWGACPVTCDGGFKTKTRAVAVQAEDGGVPCIGNSSTKEACNADPCPFDCTMMAWTDWGACTVTCGNGTKTRSRIKESERNGGKPCDPCDAPLSEVMTCENAENVNSCPPPAAAPLPCASTVHKNSPLAKKKPHPTPTGGTAVVKKEPDASKPCTKEALQATLNAYSSFSTGNVSLLIDKLTKAKAAGVLDAALGRRGRKVADVMGELRLYTTDAHLFVSDHAVKKSIQQALSDLTGVSPEHMTSDISLVSALGSSEVEQKLKGNVDVKYTISIHENDNVGDAQSLTDRLLPTSSDKVTAELKKSLLGNSISKFTLQAVSLSMKTVAAPESASGP